MKVPHDEGVADHIGPAPCVGAREGTGEASAEGRCGLGIEPRKQYSGTPTLWVSGEGNTGCGKPRPAGAQASLRRSRVVKDPMHVPKLPVGNREISCSTARHTAAGPHRGGR